MYIHNKKMLLVLNVIIIIVKMQCVVKIGEEVGTSEAFSTLSILIFVH